MNISETPAWESLASGPLDGQDAKILSLVERLYEAIDPVPADLVDRLQFAMTLDALHIEVAQLQLVSEEAMAARGGELNSAVKTMTFSSDSLTTMVTISESGPDRVRIDGWVAPGAGAKVELHQGTAQRELSADSDGRFVFDDVPHGLTRFVVRSVESERPPVITPAVEI
ncbi:MAG: carboxypeptidase regulatory-like domain-containing protein [Actinomycetota bacterium]|nr:carboxypeptidase regulatory-like domain-containing protein [Actinomycetota bacterium]